MVYRNGKTILRNKHFNKNFKHSFRGIKKKIAKKYRAKRSYSNSFKTYSSLSMPINKKIFLGLGLISVLSAQNAQDMTHSVWELWNENKAGSNTSYYVRHLRTYAGGNRGFTQNYGNNSLFIGTNNATQTPNNSSSIWFGGSNAQSGYVGFITGLFMAKDIYMTGTIGSGNAWGTGGGATLVFESSSTLTTDGANFQNNRAGTQTSWINLISNQSINLKNTNFSNQTPNGGFKVKSQSINYSGGTVSGAAFDLDNVNSSGTTTISGVNFNNNGSLTYKGGNGSGRSITFTNSNINHYTLNLNAENITFNNSTLGSVPNGNANTIGSAYTLNANNITFNNLTFDGGWFVFSKPNANINFQGTTTINNPTSPFLNMSGNVKINPNALFNIQNYTPSLGGTYTLFSMKSGTISYNDVGNLWNIIRIKNTQATKDTNSNATSSANGTHTYYVTYNLGGTLYNFREVFSPNSIILQSIYYGANGIYYTHGVNIYNNVFNLKTINNNQDNTVFYLNGMVTWNYTNASFTQTYSGKNSALVFNATTPWANGTTPNSNSMVRFGGYEGVNWGKTGYITGTFTADKIYITGTMMSGNGAQTGGGATLRFVGATEINIAGADFKNLKTTSQQSYMTFTSMGNNGSSSGKINVSHSNFYDWSNGGYDFTGNGTFDSVNFNQAHYKFQGSHNTYTFKNTKFLAGNFAFQGNTTIENHSVLDNGTYLFNGANNTFNSSTFNNGSFNFSHTQQTDTFSNNTFNNGSFGFNAQQVNFNGNTFNGGVFNFNKTPSVSFSNDTFNVKNGFILDGANTNFTFNSGVVFNLQGLLSGLNVGTSYKLARANSINYGNSTNLYQMLRWTSGSNPSGTLIPEKNNTSSPNDAKIYNVKFTDNGLTYYIRENFTQGITLTRLCTLGYTHCVNIHENAFWLKDINDSASSTVFYLNGMTTWKNAGIGTFTQNYSGADSVLVFNQTTPFEEGANPTSNSVISFGKTSGAEWGLVGYINGTFKANQIDITGTIRSGNGAKTGGGATLVFNAQKSLNIANANLNSDKAGLQNSWMKFIVDNGNLNVKNAHFSNQTPQGGFNLKANSITWDGGSVSGGGNFGVDNTNASGSAVIKNVTFSGNGTLIYKGGENNAGNSLTLENNSFNSYNINTKAQKLIFDNNTFNGGSYSFNNAQNISFKGTNTLINSDPFKHLQGSIAIENKSIFNIERDLKNNTTYTLLSGSAIKYNNESLADNVFSKSLWNIIHYDGEQGTLLRNDNNTYFVQFTQSNGQKFVFEETFNHGSITYKYFTIDSSPIHIGTSSKDIWGQIQKQFDFIPGKIAVCSGVCYIAPSKNQDLIGSTALAWSTNFGATVVGTLLLGSAQEQANDNGGSIWFGKNNLLYLHGNFNATNIFLTNNFNVGNPNAGGGATINFNADETLNADGLNYTNFQTVALGLQTSSSQHSWANFNSKLSMDIKNSNFRDFTWGGFNFNSGRMTFENSTFSGWTNINGATESGSSYMRAIANTDLIFTNSILGGGMHYELRASNIIFNNSQMVIDVSKNVNQSLLSGNVTFNNSRLTVKPNASISVGDNQTQTILENASSLSFYNDSVAHFNGRTTFEGVAYLNLNPNAQISFNQVDFNNANVTFYGIPLFGKTPNFGNSVRLINFTGDTTFNQSTLNLRAKNIHLNFQGTSTFENDSIMNLAQSSQASFNTLNVEGTTNFNLNSSSQLNFNGVSSFNAPTSFYANASQISFTNQAVFNSSVLFDLGQNSTLNFQKVVLNGTLNLLGGGSNTLAINASGNFSFGTKGLLNLSYVNLFGGENKVYQILQAQSIDGLGGASGYEKIRFYGMQIDKASYSNNNGKQLWSFTNPLNTSETITETLHNNRLKIQIAQNGTTNSSVMFNLAPSLYNYKQNAYDESTNSYNNVSDKVGTYYLTSNIKGLNKNNETPGTYNALNQRLQALHIYNQAITKQDLTTIANLGKEFLPKIAKLLSSGVLDSLNLNSPSSFETILNILKEYNITLSSTDWKSLLHIINGFSNTINQDFSQGNLVVGATKEGQTNTNSVIWFGGDGYKEPCAIGDSTCQMFRETNLGQLLHSTSPYLGYINANFKAKNIYITGTIGSGNAFGSGGSANVSFDSGTNLVLNQATIKAQGSDKLFSYLGQGGIEKIFGEKGLGNVLSNIIYEESLNNNAIPKGLSDILPKDLGAKTLGSLLNPSEVNNLLGMSAFKNAIMEILNTKTVGDVFGPNGLLNALDSAQRKEIDTMLLQQIEAHSSGFEKFMVKTLGIDNVENFINNWYGKQSLSSFANNFVPGGLNQALDKIGSDADAKALQSFLDKTTFGDILSQMLAQTPLINKLITWLGPQDLSVLINIALENITNPSKELVSTISSVGEKVLDDLLGQGVVTKIMNNQVLGQMISKIIADKGLGGVYNQGLGSILPKSLQDELKQFGMGSLLGSRGLHNFWQKGNFNFLAKNYVFVNNSSFSNATGGELNFIAGKSIIFNGNNTINFTGYQGMLSFISKDVSNISINTLNATNGLILNAPRNNISVKQGQICVNILDCATNSSTKENTHIASTSSSNAITPTNETLEVNANNFSFLGTIKANGGLDFSHVLQDTLIGTLNLEQNATLKAHNLSINTAFNNQSDSRASISGNFNLLKGATLSTNENGLSVGGNFYSEGQLIFNLNNQTNKAIINIAGTSTIMSNNNQAFIDVNTKLKQGTYTLMDAKRMVYGYDNKKINGGSLSDYLKLYTLIDFNGKRMQLNGNTLSYDNKPVDVKDGGFVVSFKDAQGQMVYSSILYNKVQITISDKPIIIQAPNLAYYINHIQGSKSLSAIYKAGGSNALMWLDELFQAKGGNPLFAPYYLQDHSTKHIVTLMEDITSALGMLSNPRLKNNSTDSLQLNTYTQQMGRLAKLSSFASFASSDFSERLSSLKNKRFADATPNAMDVVLKYSQRDKLKNNLWVTGVGGVSFVKSGTGTLYGINVGYDRFIKGVIIGGYAAYAYSGFNDRITYSGSNNVNVGLYARAFIKKSELTFSVNETWGANQTQINSNDSLLSMINQSYNYNTWTTSAKLNYGYDFMFKNKSVIFKPQIGLGYYYIGITGLEGMMNNPLYNQFRANADPSKKSVLTINFALENRHYFNKNSYFYAITGIGRDLFVNSMGDKVVRFIGDNTLSYRKGELYNTFASITTGGEVRLFKGFYANAGVGARFGLNYEMINITGNVGMRLAF
ncbi:vacuolating cytotoxin domain-containing protein [Helicobacter cetorum]|uniref:Putative vacuolating cytotoxin (VacA)-like protein n=1 Tax=Helicobacter cetorum (strain ATCC BAA-540 / CCUG 52418 / MIT 99-5656) TaxID=1163745 RepID=I0ET31_HELCM|nr:vacuolating cytotoxin domain-containing protein [Helicobacter cetorum]AFI06100.1 putative vacuolating cytotoxin (VacA)-like protein [Helicobacter cetorum MIT 99-5656]